MAERMPERMTGTGNGGAWPAVVASLGTFVVGLGGSYVWMTDGIWPPWVPPAAVALSGLAAAAVGVAVRRVGEGRPSDSGPSDSRPSESRRSHSSPPDGRAPALDAADHPAPVADERRVLDRLQVDSRGSKRVLPAGRIDWIEAAGNYSRLHVGDRSFLYRMSLGRLVEALDPSRFVRVHKSSAVNVSAVETIDSMSTGDATLHLASGAEVRMSRRYAQTFHARTGAVGTATS